MPDFPVIGDVSETLRSVIADGVASLVVCIEVLAVVHSAWFPREARRVLAPRGHYQ